MPAGYDEWFADLTAVADEGLLRLQCAPSCGWRHRPRCA